jgi:hypothetical protein
MWHYGEKGNAEFSEMRGLVRRPEGKKPLSRPRCRWEDNINGSLSNEFEMFGLSVWLRAGASGGLVAYLEGL